MTNREAFNLYVTLEAAKQLKCMENAINNALVRHSCHYRDYGIHVRIGDKLNWFRYEAVGLPIGSKEDVIKWLDEEASEKTINSLNELDRKLESGDLCKGCDWCAKMLGEYGQPS